MIYILILFHRILLARVMESLSSFKILFKKREKNRQRKIPKYDAREGSELLNGGF